MSRIINHYVTALQVERILFLVEVLDPLVPSVNNPKCGPLPLAVLPSPSTPKPVSSTIPAAFPFQFSFVKSRNFFFSLSFSF